MHINVKLKIYQYRNLNLNNDDLCFIIIKHYFLGSNSIMNVAICCLNSKFIHASLATWCLYSSVIESCEKITPKVLEGTVNNDNSVMIDKIIESNSPIVAFCCYIWNIDKTLEIAKTIKEQTGATIVLGGPEVSYGAENVLSTNDFVDFIIIGEGEVPFPTLLNAITDNEKFSDIFGLSYRNGNEIIVNNEHFSNSTPVNPYCDEYFANLNGRISYIETSRGCPYNCAFCLSGRCAPIRFFDLKSSKENIIKLANSGTQTVKFVDRTFNANVKRADEIISFIIDKHNNREIPKDVCFHFEIAGDILKDSTLTLLKNAPKGLFQLEIGMQTFNEKTLEEINRKTDTVKLIENIKKLVSFKNMHIHIDLIAGLPFEDFNSFKNSFNIGYSLNANMLQLGFLKLLYGAEMRENSQKYPCKFNDTPPYEVIETPYLSSDEIVGLHNCEDALDRLYNSGRFILTLEYLINEINYSPFDLFYDFGNSVNGSKISLSEYALKIYNYFEKKCNKEVLREKILCDLISCSSSLQIPKELTKHEPIKKRIKKHFSDKGETNIKIVILETENSAFIVNQNQKKGFDGRYEGKIYPLNIFTD